MKWVSKVLARIAVRVDSLQSPCAAAILFLRRPRATIAQPHKLVRLTCLLRLTRLVHMFIKITR